MFAQNAGNRISEVLDFKIFRGGCPRTPYRCGVIRHPSRKTVDPPLYHIPSLEHVCLRWLLTHWHQPLPTSFLNRFCFKIFIPRRGAPFPATRCSLSHLHVDMLRNSTLRTANPFSDDLLRLSFFVAGVYQC